MIDTSGHLGNPLGGPDILRQQVLEAAAAAAAAAGDDAPPAAPEPANESGVPAPPIYAPAARAEVRRIINWLADQGDQPRFFAWLPEVAEGQTDHFTDLVFDFARDGRILPICIVELRLLTPDLAKRLYERGLRRILVVDDPAVPVKDAIARVQAAREQLEEMRRGPDGRLRPLTPLDWYAFSLWYAEPSTPGAYHRVRLLNGCGVPWEMISAPPLKLGAPGEPLPEEAPAAPRHENGLPCPFFNNSITIQSNLDVLACPRFANTEGTIAGKLYRDSPEELMLNKGRRATTIGCTELCASCGLSARFHWEQKRPPIVDEYVKLGRREGGLGAKAEVPAQLEGRHIDLAVVDEEQQAAELAAFEKSLEDWAADLEGLDESTESK